MFNFEVNAPLETISPFVIDKSCNGSENLTNIFCPVPLSVASYTSIVSVIGLYV